MSSSAATTTATTTLTTMASKGRVHSQHVLLPIMYSTILFAARAILRDREESGEGVLFIFFIAAKTTNKQTNKQKEEGNTIT
jgi:hypothetical protein